MSDDRIQATVAAFPRGADTFADEITRFHAMLGSLRDDFADASLEARITDKQFLQGPLADEWWWPDLPPRPAGPQPPDKHS